MTPLSAPRPRVDRTFERMYRRYGTHVYRARRALREQLEGALTCADAELALSKQLDGNLPRAERSQLRAHLRECPDCATLARRQRAQRAALRGALGALPWSWGGLGL